VVVPAYTCFSVPSAVVAAGLRVRLVDVTPEGALDPEGLRALPLDRVAAIVACNLFGMAEPLAAVQALAAQAGAAVIDDAAQAFGARAGEGPAGGRGDAGVLSFGRGKPLACLGGGALVWPNDPPNPSEASAGGGVRPSRWAALLRALAHDVVLSPWVFPRVAALPWLHVGESHFEPEFEHGAIAGSALGLGLGALPRHGEVLKARWRRVEALIAELRERTAFRPLAPRAGDAGTFPRLAILAPNAQTREQALVALDRLGAGAGALYPTALDEVAALQPHRADADPHPAARELAARLLTLPSHPGLESSLRRRVVEALSWIR